MWRHTVTNGRGSEGGNWRMELVASTLHATSEHGVTSITTADAHTSAGSSRLNWRPPADLNGLVRFAERRNLVSARVPSHFNWPSYRLTARFAERRNLVCVRVPSHFNWPSYLLTAWVCSHNFMSYPANKAAVICVHALQYLCLHYCCQHHCLWLGYLLAILPCALYRQQQSCVYTEWR
jgi:hypothetical protein